MSSGNYVLFIGNPGSGKSTLLNSLIGKVEFESGVSIGSGLTTVFQYKEVDGIIYGDTPGLNDQTRREAAARELEKSLSQNGEYKIIFVLLSDSGRIRVEDLATIQLVIKAVAVEFPYGIVLNKLSARIRNDIDTKPEVREQLWGSFDCLEPRLPSKFFSYPSVSELCDQDNILHEPDPQFVKWIQDLTSHKILPSSVSKIEIGEYEDQKRKFEEMIADMKKKIASLEAQLEQRKAEGRITYVVVAQKFFSRKSWEIFDTMEEAHDRYQKISYFYSPALYQQKDGALEKIK